MNGSRSSYRRANNFASSSGMAGVKAGRSTSWGEIAGQLLHRATGEARYSEQARATAAAATEVFGQASRLDDQNPAFNAIFFRNLFLLGDACPAPARTLAADYCERRWRKRSWRTGLFRPWHDVNSTAPIVEIEALLAGGLPKP